MSYQPETSAEAALLADLDAAQVPYTVYEHPATATVADSARVKTALPGDATKNLFLKDKGGRYWLVTMPAEERADLRHISTMLGTTRFSFGKPEAMVDLLGVTPGSVTPLAAFNDAGGAVTVVLDAAFALDGTINIHPLRNTASLVMATSDLVTRLTAWSHPPLIVPLKP